MSARLSYFMAQQSVISSTVGGNFFVDPVALSRAVLAALAGGREEPILDAMRIIPDEKITSTENYAWWSRNLKGIVAVMKCVEAFGANLLRKYFEVDIHGSAEFAAQRMT